ncbi:MAG: polysaccharide deacetylase family protein [Armatimonadetes bacterium]|nr:polysaccharide deacetylase family protein [Armatimonadota bacterium]
MDRRVFYGAVLALMVSAIGCLPLAEGSIVYRPPLGPSPAGPNERAVEQYVVDKALDEVEPMVSVEPSAPDAVKPESPLTKAAASAKEPPWKLVRGNPAVKKIALTFDDGPHKMFTSQLLEVLRTYGVKATFFMIGRNVDAEPDLAKAAADQGIELANHTYTHERLPALTDSEIVSEIVRGADAIEKATGVRPTFFRPPGGEYDDRVARVVKEQHLTMVLWTSDAGDFTTVLGNPSPEAITQKVLRYVSPGGIVIMHDPMPNTLEALPKIILFLKSQGYEFVTVSELAADPNAVRTGGPRIVQRSGAGVHVLVEPTRYPRPKLNEAQYASPKQGTENPPKTEGKADQRVDPGSKVVQGRQGQDVGFQTSEGSRSQGPKEGGSEGNNGRKAQEGR